MLHLIVRISVRPERLADWHELAASHAAASRAEPGCVRFDVLTVHAHARQQFVLREVWTDAAALHAHRETEHYGRWRHQIASIENTPRRHESFIGPDKMLPARLLPLIAESERAQDKRIVFANGCFDLLHPGHRHLLREAKAKGDVLIVAVNSDTSVRALKGEGRPVNPLAHRLADLAELSCVDYLVSFDEETPLDLIRAVRPDVLVKGDEYRYRQIVGAEYAGREHLVPMLAGYSTTAKIEGASC